MKVRNRYLDFVITGTFVFLAFAVMYLLLGLLATLIVILLIGITLKIHQLKIENKL